MMKNVYDIRYEKNLIYILPEKTKDSSDCLHNRTYAKTAIILYLYYLETLPGYWSYIDGIQKEVDVYIVSSREDVLNEVQKHVSLSDRMRIWYVLKENRGRDVSALLITSMEIIQKYEYICFLHDKKEHSEEVKKDTDLWIENLWGNLIASPGHIDNILELFAENNKLGILAPPEPIGDHFCTWYGYGWHKSFEVTKKLADLLQLDAELAINKPPITIGTALWFKRQALQKLFDFGWRYSDFDDLKLGNESYLSYGIERLFPYVAQDAGFETGTVMSVDYARKQTGYLQYSTSILFSEANNFFPVTCISDLERYKRNREKIISFAEKNKRIYLYGAGEMGRFCFFLLRENNILPEAYLVSEIHEETMVCGLPVYSIQEIEDLSGHAVIITVFGKKSQEEMARNLAIRGFNNYFVFWD